MNLIREGGSINMVGKMTDAADINSQNVISSSKLRSTSDWQRLTTSNRTELSSITEERKLRFRNY